MLIAAAVCPHPPLLIPAALGAAGREPQAALRAVGEACQLAVAALVAAGPDLIAVVGGGPADREYEAGAAGSLHDFGVPVTVGEGEPVLPLPLTAGRWLLGAATAGRVWAPQVLLQAVQPAGARGDCLKLGVLIAERAPRVAVLAMGDASARRACGPPGAADPEAQEYDDEVAGALAAADARRLRQAGPGARRRPDGGGPGRLAGAGGCGRRDPAARQAAVGGQSLRRHLPGRLLDEPGGGLRPVPERVIAVIGPTSAGKSELSLRLCLALGGEVVNADSMQLYTGMDIGTAKLSPGQRRGVPHHLLDIWDVRQAASVAAYQRLARDAIAVVGARGRVPVLAGGSGLYLRAALDNLEFPGTDPVVRDRLEAELAVAGPAALHARLAALDPAAARAILPSNGRRVVRALEVIEIAGRPFAAVLPEYESRYPAIQIGLRVSRGELDRRIAERTARMWREGLVDEVAALERAGLREGRTASRALGYAQVLRFLAGECSEDEARAQTILATRRFARRQQAWFRRDPRVIWLDADTGDAGALLDEALAACARGPVHRG